MEFRLGNHGQGYEISSVSIDLAAAPSDLTVSLWMGKHSGSGHGGERVKLFDFENPASFRTRLNEFTAPAGAFAYQASNTSSCCRISAPRCRSMRRRRTMRTRAASRGPLYDKQRGRGHQRAAAGREGLEAGQRHPGFELRATRRGRPGGSSRSATSAVSRWTSEHADRYLIRGLLLDRGRHDQPFGKADSRNPFELHEGSSTGVKDGDDTRRLTMYNTRNNEGVAARTAPLGATVAGGSKTYTFLLDLDLGRDGEGNKIERIDAVLISQHCPRSGWRGQPGRGGLRSLSIRGCFISRRAVCHSLRRAAVRDDVEPGAVGQRLPLALAAPTTRC